MQFRDYFYLSGVDITGAAGLTTFTNQVTINGPVSIASVVDLNDTIGVDWDSYLSLTGGGTISGTVDIGFGGNVKFGGGKLFTVDGPTWFTGVGEADVMDAGTTVKLDDAVEAFAFGLDPGVTLEGPGHLTVELLDWEGGEQKGGGTTFVTQVVTMTGAADKYLNGRALQINSGASAYLAEGALNMTNAATIDVETGALFSLQNDTDILAVANTQITNYGWFEKAGGDGQSEVQAPFWNHGTGTSQTGVLAHSGELIFKGGGSSFDRFETTNENAQISFLDGDYGCFTGTKFRGPGWTLVSVLANLVIPNGEVVYNEGRFELGIAFAGIVGTGPNVGNGAFHNDPGALFKWSGGWMEDLYFANNGRVEIDASVVFLRGTQFVNFHEVVWKDGDIVFALSSSYPSYTALLVNHWSFDIQCDKTIINQTNINVRPGGTIPAPGGGTIPVYVGIVNWVDPDDGLPALFSKVGFSGQTTINVFFYNHGGTVLDPWVAIVFAGGYEED